MLWTAVPDIDITDGRPRLGRLDERFLAGHDSYRADDIEERAFYMDVAGGRCFSLLYLPPRPRDLGFVVCHSYGRELITLRRAERALARTLAGAGHPVLSFNRRGYGDSTGSLADATLAWHLEDTAAAAERLAEESGARRLGLVGAKFGALVAGVMARGGGVDRLLLVNPALRGEKYFRQFIKDKMLVRVTIDDGSPPTVDDMVASLRQDGVVDILGQPLYRHLYDEAAEIDLVEDVGAFSGEALVLHATKSATLPRDLEAFRRGVEQRGGRCILERIEEPPGAKLGHMPFVTTTDPLVRKDYQRPILEAISAAAAGWVSS